jgi:hypothetical protein
MPAHVDQLGNSVTGSFPYVLAFFGFLLVPNCQPASMFFVGVSHQSATVFVGEKAWDYMHSLRRFAIRLRAAAAGPERFATTAIAGQFWITGIGIHIMSLTTHDRT